MNFSPVNKLPRTVRLSRLWEDAKATLVPRGEQVRTTCPWRRNYRLPACRVKICEFSQSQIRKNVNTVTTVYGGVQVLHRKRDYLAGQSLQLHRFKMATKVDYALCHQKRDGHALLSYGTPSIPFIDDSGHKICLTRCFLAKF